mmetsp:Transcript_29895/g.57433  ORF Transcript_29895/g.57433 Transcript_29895/m.57433 type:complete len:263 (-) Transcript_29895:1010-1798(-)
MRSATSRATSSSHSPHTLFMAACMLARMCAACSRRHDASPPPSGAWSPLRNAEAMPKAVCTCDRACVVRRNLRKPLRSAHCTSRAVTGAPHSTSRSMASRLRICSAHVSGVHPPGPSAAMSAPWSSISSVTSESAAQHAATDTRGTRWVGSRTRNDAAPPSSPGQSSHWSNGTISQHVSKSTVSVGEAPWVRSSSTISRLPLSSANSKGDASSSPGWRLTRAPALMSEAATSRCWCTMAPLRGVDLCAPELRLGSARWCSSI